MKLDWKILYLHFSFLGEIICSFPPPYKDETLPIFAYIDIIMIMIKFKTEDVLRINSCVCPNLWRNSQSFPQSSYKGMWAPNLKFQNRKRMDTFHIPTY